MNVAKPVDETERRRRRLEEEREEEKRLIAGFEQGLRNGDASSVAAQALYEHLSGLLPGMLYRLWRAGELNDHQLRDAVAELWIKNKSPVSGDLSPASGLSKRRWVELFHATDFLTRCEGVPRGEAPVAAALEHVHFEKQPTESLTVYRGEATRTQGRGMSWTLDPACAEKFAIDTILNPETAEPTVFEATVPGRAVLAVFCDERDQEVVVNPKMLVGRAAPVVVVDGEREERFRAALAEQRAHRERLRRLFHTSGDPGHPD